MIPGGFSGKYEMPQQTAEREVLEETGVLVKANELIVIRFTAHEVWCIFSAAYLCGIPISDGEENNEAVFMSVDEALGYDNVVDTTKEVLRTMLKPNKSALVKSDL